MALPDSVLVACINRDCSERHATPIEVLLPTLTPGVKALPVMICERCGSEMSIAER
jgi:hypothetical protein